MIQFRLPTLKEQVNIFFLAPLGDFSDILGTKGGILLGASIPNILAMTIAEKYSILGTLVSVGLSIIGAFLIAFHFAKD